MMQVVVGELVHERIEELMHEETGRLVYERIEE